METVTNALRKLVSQLDDVKHRRRTGLFMAEGDKCVADTAGNFVCRYLIARKEWFNSSAAVTAKVSAEMCVEATASDMERMSRLTTPPRVIAVYEIPERQPDFAAMAQCLVVALDAVRDPGNLGTIIRLCDWMGVEDILASSDCADLWSPKVIQATMGAVSRVRVHYCDLAATLRDWPTPVRGTFLDGENIYSAPLGASGVVVFGNEGRGISEAVGATVSQRLLIPSFPPGRKTSESLNVATAAAITLAEFRSRQLRSRN